mgnify:CR=1 FL=1
MTSSQPHSPQDLASTARRLNARNGPDWPALVLLTDDTRLADPREAIKSLPQKSAVLFRHYDDPERAGHLARWAGLARDHGHAVWVAKDVDLARRLNADVLHMPEGLMGEINAIQNRHPGLTISAAAHSADAVMKAANLSLGAVLISPVFSTRSHPGAEPLGPDKASALARLAHECGMRAYALGGIRDETAVLLAGSHFTGLAAIDALAG